MIEAKYQALVNGLVKKTAEGAVSWEVDEEREGVFFAKLAGNYVQLSTRPDPDFPESPDIIVEILNAQGKMIEKFSNVELQSATDEGGQAYKSLKELYTLARRNANNFEHLLDEMLDKLES